MEVKIGKGLALDVATERFTREVMDHVTYIGLRNILMDAHANVNQNTVMRQVNGHQLDDAEWAAEIKKQSLDASAKKLAAMYNGEVRAMSERTRVDPVEGEARRMALIDIQAALRKAGKKLNSYTGEQYARQVDKNFAKYIPAAKKVVEMRAKANVEVDMEGLI